MIKKLVSVALAAALMPTPAVAQMEVRQTRVSYADLDIASAAGRATLDSRIKRAANRVCGPLSASSVAEHKLNQDCLAGAIAGADLQLQQVLASRTAGTDLAARR